MRHAVAAAILALNPISAFAAPVIPADAVVMPDTPSGKGDPNTLVCRAPQQLAGSDQMGPKRCGYNFEWWQLTTHGKDLAPDGTTVVDRPMVVNPTGLGNPDAVTCRKPQHVAGSGQSHGPEVCQTNDFWASLGKDGKAVAPDGTLVKRVNFGKLEGGGFEPFLGERAFPDGSVQP